MTQENWLLRDVGRRCKYRLCFFIAATFGLAGVSLAQTSALLPVSQNSIQIKPYARNIVHVLIRLPGTPEAPAAGYGIIAKPERSGWKEREDGPGRYLLQSDRMSVSVVLDNNGDRAPKGIPLDKLNLSLRDVFFHRVANQETCGLLLTTMGL